MSRERTTIDRRRRESSDRGGVPLGRTLVVLAALVGITFYFARSDGGEAINETVVEGAKSPATLPRADESEHWGLPVFEPVGEGPLLAGPESEDVYGYPLARPDKVALLQLLRTRQFDRLERELGHFIEASSDFKHELWGVDAVRAFATYDPHALEDIDAWIAAKPESWYAVMARGHQLKGRAWFTRGQAVSALVHLANQEAAADYFKQARAEFERAISMAGGHWLPVHSLVGVLTVQGITVDKLEGYLAQQLEHCPNCTWPHRTHLWALGPQWSIMGTDGRSESSIADHVDKLRGREKENPRFEVLFGAVARRACHEAKNAKDWPRAERECRAAKTGAFDPHTDYELARVLYEQKRFDEAAKLLDGVLEVLPQYEDALSERYYLHVQKDPQEADEAAHIVLRWARLNPYSKQIAADPARWYLDWMTAQGLADMKHGKKEEARDKAWRAYLLNPWHKRTCTLAGKVFEQVDPGFAADHAAEHPNDATALQLASCVYLTARNFAAIVELWTPYVEAHPDDPVGYYRRGAGYFHLRDKAKAKADLVKACELGAAYACARAKKMVGTAL